MWQSFCYLDTLEQALTWRRSAVNVVNFQIDLMHAFWFQVIKASNQFPPVTSTWFDRICLFSHADLAEPDKLNFGCQRRYSNTCLIPLFCIAVPKAIQILPFIRNTHELGTSKSPGGRAEIRCREYDFESDVAQFTFRSQTLYGSRISLVLIAREIMTNAKVEILDLDLNFLTSICARRVNFD